MKNVRIIIAVVVLLNVAVIGWLLVRRPQGSGPTTLGAAMDQALSDGTMQQSSYDLSDRGQTLNVLLISMDALRWDRTGLSGNRQGLTPNLDAFAEEAVVFHDAVAPASWTLPSHMAVFTGRWPSVHGVTNKLRLLSQDQLVPTSLSPGIETFPDYLIRAGRTAAAFTGGAGVQAAYGFGRGFDTYQDDRPFAGLDYGIEPALAWLQQHRGQPFFLFLHGYDSHGQYELAESKRQALRAGFSVDLDGSIVEQARLREQGLDAIQQPGDAASLRGVLDEEDARFLAAVYDQKVKDADERLGTFLDRFRAMGLLDETVVVILSDHGDELMEHGALDHGYTLYEEQLHVFLMMRLPGFARRQDIEAPVRLVDVFPTVFDALGLEGPKGVDGQSLLPLMRGQPEELPIFSETDYRLFVHHRMTRRGDYKLILDLADGEKELFDLEADPGEKTDISSQNPRETYELEQKLRGWMDQTRTNPQDYMGIRQKPIELF
ncbi:MAG: sulfatase [Pseudomonadota bacterium]